MCTWLVSRCQIRRDNVTCMLPMRVPVSSVQRGRVGFRRPCTTSRTAYRTSTQCIAQSAPVTAARTAQDTQKRSAGCATPQHRFKYVYSNRQAYNIQPYVITDIREQLPSEFGTLQIPGRLKFKLTGDADYVQPGLLSPAEQQRLESMDLGPVIAEVAATSCTHRKLASQRAQKEEHTTSGTSRYLGVHKRGRRWFFKFKRKADDRTTVRQATFDSEEEAARGYDKLAWETDGWVAILNFPEEYGMPVSRPAPQQPPPKLTPPPCDAFRKYLRWVNSHAAWQLSPERKEQFKLHGVTIPTSFTFQQECIRADQMMSLCLFGEIGAGPCLLLTKEHQRLLSVHSTLLQQCSVDGKLDPECVTGCKALGRVVAEIYATSSEHRRHAVKCAEDNFRGVEQVPSGRWRARIWIGLKKKYLGTYEAPMDAAYAYDDAAFEQHGWRAVLNNPSRLGLPHIVPCPTHRMPEGETAYISDVSIDQCSGGSPGLKLLDRPAWP